MAIKEERKKILYIHLDHCSVPIFMLTFATFQINLTIYIHLDFIDNTSKTKGHYFIALLS